MRQLSKIIYMKKGRDERPFLSLLFAESLDSFSEPMVIIV